MKPIKWENPPGGVAALLLSKSFAFCDLYTFELQGGFSGQNLYYTTSDVDVGYDAGSGLQVWSHYGPYFDVDKMRGGKAVAHWKAGLDVDTWQVIIQPRAIEPLSGTPNPDTIGGILWQQAATAGVLDGAYVLVDRAFFAAAPTYPLPSVTGYTGTPPSKPFVAPVGVVNIFTGRVAEVDVGRSSVGISVNSHLELLGISMPRNVFQATCRNILFDTACGLNRMQFAVPGQVNSIAAGPQSAYVGTNLSNPGGTGAYTLGQLVWTSGANKGFSRAVRWDFGEPIGGFPPGSRVLQLISPLPFAMAPGDNVIGYPGCDKSTQACQAFNNLGNYRGEPYIPAPETAV